MAKHITDPQVVSNHNKLRLGCLGVLHLACSVSSGRLCSPLVFVTSRVCVYVCVCVCVLQALEQYARLGVAPTALLRETARLVARVNGDFDALPSHTRVGLQETRTGASAQGPSQLFSGQPCFCSNVWALLWCQAVVRLCCLQHTHVGCLHVHAACPVPASDCLLVCMFVCTHACLRAEGADVPTLITTPGADHKSKASQARYPTQPLVDFATVLRVRTQSCTSAQITDFP